MWYFIGMLLIYCISLLKLNAVEWFLELIYFHSFLVNHVFYVS
jgi:hypothetical protein